MDDSVAYQVYNNIEENEDSILAVKDTYGKVVEYNGEVITAYYFSTHAAIRLQLSMLGQRHRRTLSERQAVGVEEDSKDVLSGGAKAACPLI